MCDPRDPALIPTGKYAKASGHASCLVTPREPPARDQKKNQKKPQKTKEVAAGGLLGAAANPEGTDQVQRDQGGAERESTELPSAMSGIVPSSPPAVNCYGVDPHEGIAVRQRMHSAARTSRKPPNTTLARPAGIPHHPLAPSSTCMMALPRPPFRARAAPGVVAFSSARWARQELDIIHTPSSHSWKGTRVALHHKPQGS